MLHDFRRILFSHLNIMPSHMDLLMKVPFISEKLLAVRAQHVFIPLFSQNVNSDAQGYVPYKTWLADFSRDYRPTMAGKRPKATEAPSGLAARIAAGAALRSSTHAASLEANHLPYKSTTIQPHGPSERQHVGSISDVMTGKRGMGELVVNSSREMQLVDEIRALRLGPEREMELLRDLPVSADKKIDYFRELQLNNAVEKSFLTDMRQVDYMRASIAHANPTRKESERILAAAPERERRLVGEIRNMPITEGRRRELINELPIGAGKKIGINRSLTMSNFVDSTTSKRPIAL